MDARSFYESREKVLGRIFSQLQADSQSLSPELAPPEAIEDSILRDLLAISYIYATGFAGKKRLMGEFGGVLPQNPENNKRILAISKPSLEKVMCGIIAKTTKSRNSHLPNNAAELFFGHDVDARMDPMLEDGSGLTIVDGNQNVAHYDFTTCAGKKDVLDILKTNLYLLLGAEGFCVCSNKHLPGQQYVFNVPANPELFEKLKPTSIEKIEERIEIVKKAKECILPQDYIAGFHIAYENRRVNVAPLIASSDAEKHSQFFSKHGLECTPSAIYAIGESDAFGRPVGIAVKPIVDNQG